MGGADPPSSYGAQPLAVAVSSFIYAARAASNDDKRSLTIHA